MILDEFALDLLHFVTYPITSVVNGVVSIFAPAIDAINYVISEFVSVINDVSVCISLFPLWLSIPILLIMFTIVGALILGVVTKIVGTLVLSGWFR